jgi:hypothetical protein
VKKPRQESVEDLTSMQLEMGGAEGVGLNNISDCVRRLRCFKFIDASLNPKRLIFMGMGVE